MRDWEGTPLERERAATIVPLQLWYEGKIGPFSLDRSTRRLDV